MKEEWRDVRGFEGKYKVSNLGRVLSLVYKNERLMKLMSYSNGYLFVSLCSNNKRKNYSVHRLVAMAFLENPENKREVNHKNGDKTDNRAENLEWVTPRENIRHAIRTGLLKPDKNPEYLWKGWQKKREEIIASIAERSSGEKSPMHKRTNEQVLKIRQMYRDGMKIIDIANFYGIHHGTIADIVRGKSWKHLPYDNIKPNLRKRAILRIKGEGVVRYNSITEASKEYMSTNKSAHSAISACCRGKRENYMGYKWQYFKENG